MNELSAAYLWGQLNKSEEISQNRLNSWNFYYEGLQDIEKDGLLTLPVIPRDCEHNAHMFYIKVADAKESQELIAYLKSLYIMVVFHYIPLHSSVAGKKFGLFSGIDKYTSRESGCLLRLPIFYGLKKQACLQVISAVTSFYKSRRKKINSKAR